MEFKDIVRYRYATKNFDGKAIPEPKLQELFEMIRLTPSAVNIQPWKIKVINDQKRKKALFPATFNQEQITSCSHLLVFCANTDTDGLIDKVSGLMKAAGVPDEIRNTAVNIAKGMTGTMSPEIKLGWAKCQVYLALETALYGAASLELASCPMTGFNPDEYARILKLPQNLVPTILCALGYPADAPGPKIRLAKEDIFF